MIPTRTLRSLLFVPGDRPDRIAKASGMDTDAVVVDLEDAVAPTRLAFARAELARALGVHTSSGAAWMVRVHSARSMDALSADLKAIVDLPLFAVMLPKTEGPDDVRALERMWGEKVRSRERDRIPGIVPLIESCQGLRSTFEVARSSDRLAGMAFSSGEEGDFMADLGGHWSPDGLALQFARSRFLCDVRAAGDLVALDGVFMRLNDSAALSRECEIASTLGFDGKMAIHPRQLPVINRHFTPSRQQIAEAEGLLSALQAASEDAASVTTFDGRMVDPANARVARRTLARAGLVQGET